MTNAKLARKVAAQARRAHRRGEMTDEQYKSAMDVANSDKALTELNAKIEEAQLDPYKYPNRLIGLDWKERLKNLWDWFVENWPKILQFILTIAPLFLMETENEDS
jgi:hypothetical protein